MPLRLSPWDTAYEDPRAPLGADICTGGPGALVWTFMQCHDDFEDMVCDELLKFEAHATLGCGLVDGPIDAPEHLPAGSTEMDWFPRTTMSDRD